MKKALLIFDIIFIIVLFLICCVLDSEDALYHGAMGGLTAAGINGITLLISRRKNKNEAKEQEEQREADKATKSAEALQNRIFQHAASETTGEKNAVCIFCGRRVSAVDQDNLCETCAKLVNESDK